jgi:DnaJ-class molecular chaperone
MITLTKATCPHCGGTGFLNMGEKVVIAPNTRMHLVLRLRECEPCDGRGEILNHNLPIRGKRSASIAK